MPLLRLGMGAAKWVGRNPGKALIGGIGGAIAYGEGKRIAQHQRQRRVHGAYPPGGAPPMRKISAKQGLNHFLKKAASERRDMDKEAIFGRLFQAGARAGAGAGRAAKGAAPPGQLAKAIPWALGIGAGLSAGGMAVGGAARGVGGAYQRFQANRMFKELQQRYPEIRRHKDARKYFDMIIAYAPSLMRHHAAIGDFLTRQLQYPMSSVEFIKQLADLEGTVSKTESYSAATQMAKGTAEGGKGMLVPLAGV